MSLIIKIRLTTPKVSSWTTAIWWLTISPLDTHSALVCRTRRSIILTWRSRTKDRRSLLHLTSRTLAPLMEQTSLSFMWASRQGLESPKEFSVDLTRYPLARDKARTLSLFLPNKIWGMLSPIWTSPVLTSFLTTLSSYSIWDVVSQTWVRPQGQFNVFVGKSVLDIQLKGSF